MGGEGSARLLCLVVKSISLKGIQKPAQHSTFTKENHTFATLKQSNVQLPFQLKSTFLFSDIYYHFIKKNVMLNDDLLM